ncbi:AraC family transcriptional regulator [Litoribrevibacter albus]|uniref:AraC family transcriptional regulator n=1 Tax=Litoribrevibacter albus TaxID=1473156 RepID=A0AA37SBQ7_9GAMM|nr:AraC family transcriptional regulator [Litoribrevibacter albus]GLQ31868.1 AraC family transcriptional regulator [Litoribrevibacter albus]
MFRFGPNDKVFDFRYFPPLIRTAVEEGADLCELLRGTCIPESALGADDYKVSVSQLEVLVGNISQLCRPFLIMEYGSQLNLSAFGIVGYAALSSPTARDALRIANQYMPIVLPLLDIQVEEKSAYAAIKLELTYPISTNAGKALLEASLASLYTMAQFVLLDKMPKVRLEVKHKLEPYHFEFAQMMDADIQGECQHNQIFIPTDVLNLPLPLANQVSFNMSIKQCDELMEQLPTLDRSLTSGIQRRLLHHQGETQLTQEEIARELFISVRTLHRFLKREGSSFRDIVNDTLTLKAKYLLEEDKYSISQIAQELGYTDAANFTRAFRNHTGATPTEYRKKIQVPS